MKESGNARYDHAMLTRLIAIFALFASVSVAAQKSEVPYWASISAPEVYMRVGPSQSYPIDWVYQRQGLPVKVLRVNQGWRYVEDPDGARGWIYAAMLSGKRGAIVVGDTLAPIRAQPTAEAALSWNAEPGVVGALGECEEGWCAFDVEGRAGWIEAARLWGVGAP